MNRRLVTVLAVLAVVVGGVFTFQGIGVLKGSFMTGSATWAVIGVALVVAGIVGYARATRPR